MQDRFVARITQVPEILATPLIPLLGASFSGHISKAELENLIADSGMERNELLLALLPIAAALANPPISDFYVGAIAIGSSGDLYMGANMELAGEALGQAVHAEQNAISHAWLKGEAGIEDIIVNASPCGHCRQFINELVQGSDIRIHLPGQATAPLAHYLPYAFGPKDLNITAPLLTPQSIELALETDDPLLIEALDQANQSYAPYSSNHAAVAIETHDGQVFVGRYAENAAFNPSMMPLQMALGSLMRHNLGFDAIERVVLLESSAGKISLANASVAALGAVTQVQLEHVVAEPC
ncbi:cytidine deaminase [Shewanella corallii]|uniref:Cytidine deaminase n=1 Tax=Shewanella corallii TaxID=560080 RepID=A0ABT0N9D5_9GAMM|nr:cytidine deaminase [Shewanella corallii]MCL2914750.1 cytidine deaminase [Shewanella corallii]